MIETIIKRYLDGDYNTPNGKELFQLDMRKAQEEHVHQIHQLQEEIEKLDTELMCVL